MAAARSTCDDTVVSNDTDVYFGTIIQPKRLSPDDAKQAKTTCCLRAEDGQMEYSIDLTNSLFNEEEWNALQGCSVTLRAERDASALTNTLKLKAMESIRPWSHCLMQPHPSTTLLEQFVQHHKQALRELYAGEERFIKNISTDQANKLELCSMTWLLSLPCNTPLLVACANDIPESIHAHTMHCKLDYIVARTRPVGDWLSSMHAFGWRFSQHSKNNPNQDGWYDQYWSVDFVGPKNQNDANVPNTPNDDDKTQAPEHRSMNKTDDARQYPMCPCPDCQCPKDDTTTTTTISSPSFSTTILLWKQKDGRMKGNIDVRHKHRTTTRAWIELDVQSLVQHTTDRDRDLETAIAKCWPVLDRMNIRAMGHYRREKNKRVWFQIERILCVDQ